VTVERYVPPRRRLGRPPSLSSEKPSDATPTTETGELGDTPQADAAGPQPPDGATRDSDTLSRAHEQGVQEGYEKGYDAGVQAGYRQGYEAGAQETEAQLTAALETHFNSLLNALKAGGESVASEIQRLGEQFEATFPHAVLLVAEAVVRHEVQTNEATLKALIHETMSQFDRTAKVSVHLNPADYERLADQPAEVWSSEHLSFVPDDTVSAGGALFTTETGVVDARLETRLIEAARALLFPASDE
jgi:flagellar biosynthesis/type III secretory pathway protein FliH